MCGGCNKATSVGFCWARLAQETPKFTVHSHTHLPTCLQLPLLHTSAVVTTEGSASDDFQPEALVVCIQVLLTAAGHLVALGGRWLAQLVEMRNGCNRMFRFASWEVLCPLLDHMR